MSRSVHSVCLRKSNLERQKTKEEMERLDVLQKCDLLQNPREYTAEISSQIHKAIDNHIPSQVDATTYQLYLSMKADPQLQQQDIAIWLALQMKLESLQVPQTTCRTSVVRPRDQDDPHDDAHPEGENRAKRQNTSEYEAYVSGESSSRHRDPEAPPLSLINQDLLYLKKESSGPEKIVVSLYKFPAIIFNDDDIKERTSRWKQNKSPVKTKEVIYSNSKIIQVIKTYWELGHEHKFITEIVARRANECIVLITEPDYKNLNKNDIEDMYLLIMNGKVPDYAEIGLLLDFNNNSSKFNDNRKDCMIFTWN
ncbi:hypothetical protein Tco_0422703 [Tanacetum coccineum]